MKEQQNDDTRGFDLKVDNFRTQLINLINSCSLPISTVMYIMKDIYYDVSNEYNRVVGQQYELFCQEAKKGHQQKEEEENSSSSKMTK